MYSFSIQKYTSTQVHSINVKDMQIFERDIAFNPMYINKIQTNFNNHTYEYSTFEILNKDHVPIDLRKESYKYCTIIPIFFSVLNVKIHNLRV